jgi:hypothetical protein
MEIDVKLAQQDIQGHCVLQIAILVIVRLVVPLLIFALNVTMDFLVKIAQLLIAMLIIVKLDALFQIYATHVIQVLLESIVTHAMLAILDNIVFQIAQWVIVHQDVWLQMFVYHAMMDIQEMIVQSLTVTFQTARHAQLILMFVRLVLLVIKVKIVKLVK